MIAPITWEIRYIRTEEIMVNNAIPALFAVLSSDCSIRIRVIMLVNNMVMLKVTEEVNRDGSILAMAAPEAAARATLSGTKQSDYVCATPVSRC